MSGPQWAMLYQVAVETGLRRAELASLTRALFDLNGDQPTVTVAAAYSKNRRADTVPLRITTAEALRYFLADKMPRARAFNMPPRRHNVAMLCVDLKAAGIPYRDEDNRVADFHALRHTCGSWLAAAGVHPKVMQGIMRHSTITLTMDKYTHPFKNDQAEGIAKLPDLSDPGCESMAATGTNGENTQPKNWVSYWASRVRKHENRGDPQRQNKGKPTKTLRAKTPVKQAKKRCFTGKKTVGVGFEPTVSTRPTPVFKTGPFNRSGTPPALLRRRFRSIRRTQSILFSRPYTHCAYFWRVGSVVIPITLNQAVLTESGYCFHHHLSSIRRA